MATFTVGPDGKLLMDGKPIDNLWGSLGRNVTDVSTGDVGFYRSQPGAYDPNFYEQYDMGGSEGSSNVGYRLRPDVQQQLGGRIQIGQTGVGGAAEVIDPSKLAWDEQYGVLTEPSNIKAPQDSMLDRAIGPIFSALVNPAIAMGSGSMFQTGGLLGGNAAAGGLSQGAGTSGLVDIPGNLSWTDIAAESAGLLPAPEIAGGGGLLGAIGSAITKNPLLAASIGMQAGGLLGGGGNKPAGSSWSAGSNAGGGLNIKSAEYVPNQHTERQLQELYGSNNMGMPSSGQMGGQSAPWQNNLYGGGQQGMPMTGGQQNYPSMAPKPMEMGGGLLQGMSGQNFGTKPMMMGGAGDFGPLPPGQPIGQPGGNASIVNGRLNIGGVPAPNLMPAIQQRPPIGDQYVDQSVRNSAIGDGYSGLRNGFLYAGGQRLMPTTGSAQQDQATLRQFGIRPPTFGSQYGF